MKNNHLKDKSNAGGSATGGGINYQARVTAIACVHLLRGTKLSWLENIVDDIPVSICAETGGSGDDISVCLITGEIVEIQVKKGLSSGDRLWKPLLKLALAIQEKEINYGILIISPSSSQSIKEQLSRDIIRLGDGRKDGLSKIGEQFLSKIQESNLCIADCCKKLRIQTVNAVQGNNSDVKAAISDLDYISENKNLWSVLLTDATNLIENEDRRDLSSLHNVINSNSIVLKPDIINSAINLLDKLNKWTIDTHRHFSIIGINKEFSISDSWIPVKIKKLRFQDDNKFTDVNKAILNYQTYGQKTKSIDIVYINPETLAQFKTQTILIGGPGMGKTTLLKRIASSYSNDSIPVLNVRLSMLANSMRGGSSFEDALFSLGLDGSGITQSDVESFKFKKWLILCDGLDECGNMSEQVAEGIRRFSLGYHESKFIVTTRPIGYETNLFAEWSHYQIVPLDSKYITNNLSKLISTGADNSKLQINVENKCKNILKNDLIKSLIGRSPLMLGFAASIIINGEDIAETKTELYKQIFKLIQKVSNNRKLDHNIESVIANRFVDILGWHVALNPLMKKSNILNLCATDLAKETQKPDLISLSETKSYLQYWIDIGIVEELSYSNDKYLVFIHKSFGEFTAAQNLSSMSGVEQRKKVKDFINKPNLNEVLHFFARLGHSDIVLQDILLPIVQTNFHFLLRYKTSC